MVDINKFMVGQNNTSVDDNIVCYWSIWQTLIFEAQESKHGGIDTLLIIPKVIHKNLGSLCRNMR